MVLFSTLCSESFRHDSDPPVVFKFRKIWLTGNRWNCALLTWHKHNFAWLSNCRYCADWAKNLPGSVNDNIRRVL